MSKRSRPSASTSKGVDSSKAVLQERLSLAKESPKTFARHYRRKISPMSVWDNSEEISRRNISQEGQLTSFNDGLDGGACGGDFSGSGTLWQPLLLANPEKIQKQTIARQTNLPVSNPNQSKPRESTDKQIYKTDLRIERAKLIQLDPVNFQQNEKKGGCLAIRETIAVVESAKPDEISQEKQLSNIKQKIVPTNLKLYQDFSQTTEKLFKVLLIGDPGVGKTSFVQRYTNDIYRTDYKGTVGVDFSMKIIRMSKDTTVKLQLWDVAGQERFTWMTRVYYRDAKGCIIMFDLANRNSFRNITRWKRDLDSKCTLGDGSPIPSLLLANKCDLKDRKVDSDEIENVYKKLDFIGWTETSAKDDMMVKDSVKFLIDTMLKKEKDVANQISQTQTIKITKEDLCTTHKLQPGAKTCYMC